MNEEYDSNRATTKPQIHSTTVAENLPDPNHYKEQLDILLHAIALTSKLAATEIPRSSGTKRAGTNAKEQIQAEIDTLQQQWKLEDTALPPLISSVHRLHSNIGNLQNESINLTSRIHSTEDTLHSAQAHNAKLKDACLKLFRQNKKLTAKIKHKKRESRQFVKTVRDFLTKKKEEELDTEEFLVACHESMMKKSCGYSTINDNCVVGNRQRTSTAESTFSDYSYGSMFEGVDEEIESKSKAAETLDHTSNFVDYDCDASINSYISTSSRSYITDDAIATLRFTDVMVCNGNDDAIDSCDNIHETGGAASFMDNGIDHEKSHSTRPHINVSYKNQSSSYTLSFPCSKEIGIQLVEVPSTITRIQNSVASGGNRRRAFSDGAVLDLDVVDESKESKLTVSSRSAGSCNKIDEEDVCDKTQPKMRPPPLSPGHMSKKSAFSMDKIFGVKSKKKQRNDEKELSSCPGPGPAAQMILVRDLEGFDTSLNVRPTIGARLIAIDSQSLLGGQWTLQKATEYLEERKKKVEVTKITFRNDLLTKAQKKLLETTDAAPENGDNTTLNDGACPKPLISSFRMPKAKVAEKAQNDKKPLSAFFKFSTKSDSDGCNGDESQMESMFSSFMSKNSGKREKNEETANPSCDNPADSIPPTDTPTQQLSESSNHTHAKSATEEDSVANLTTSKEDASSKALPQSDPKATVGMAESSSNQETDGGDDPQKESFFGKFAKTNDKEKSGDEEVHDESTFSMKFISLF